MVAGLNKWRGACIGTLADGTKNVGLMVDGRENVGLFARRLGSGMFPREIPVGIVKIGQ